jgi:hypothetical protein
MPDETGFTPKPGDVVLDRDDDDPDPAVVANAPDIPAEDWTIPWLEKTIAEDNPDYPADAPIALVVYVHHLEETEEALPEWDRENAVAISELNESSLSYYVFPQPRLHSAETGPESGTESSESTESTDGPAITDIQHVGESRADDLREAGYESVGDVATADKSAVAEIDGIGETRAEQITASATDMLGDQPGASESDAPDETEPDTTESRETPEADTDLSAAVVALSRFLDSDGMEATIADDGESVRVAKADDNYRVSLDGVEGDGPHRSQLEEAVEKVRAATEREPIARSASRTPN